MPERILSNDVAATGDPSPSEWVALVDIGSNAVRCVLARLDARPGFEIALWRRVQTRLGESPSNTLPADAIDATLRVTRRFLKRVRRQHPGVRVLGVATAAVRDAENRAALLAPLAELGVRDLRILSGDDEGRLGAEAALRAVPIELGMVIDIGGGSLQVTAVVDGVIQQSASAPAGVVRLRRRFLDTDPPAPEQVEALRLEIRTRIVGLLRAVPTGGRALACGGVVTAIARLASSLQDPERTEAAKQSTHGYTLLAAEVGALRAWLEPMTTEARANVPSLRADRADVILVGAIVLEELMSSSGYSSLTACRTSVRDAVLLREALMLAG